MSPDSIENSKHTSSRRNKRRKTYPNKAVRWLRHLRSPSDKPWMQVAHGNHQLQQRRKRKLVPIEQSLLRVVNHPDERNPQALQVTKKASAILS